MLVGIFVFLSCPFIFAAETKTTNVSLDITALARAKITNPNQSINLSGTAGVDAFDQGFVVGAQRTPKLEVSCNTNWNLTAKVASDWNMVGSYQKATSDLRLRVNSSYAHQNGFATYMPLSLTEQEIATHIRGANREDYRGRYRILLDWEKDVPGTYSIMIVYTLTTQA